MKSTLHPLAKFRHATLLGLAVFTIHSASASEGVLALDWQQAGPGFPTDRWVGDVYVSPARAQVQLLNETTDPASPFSGGSLLVQNTPSDGRLMIRGRPYAEPKKSGWMTFQASVIEGTVTLTVGGNSKDFMPKNDQSLILESNDSRFSIQLRADQTIIVGKHQLITPQVSNLEANTPYTIKIAWDFTAAEPGFSIFINGEPTTVVNEDKPFLVPVSAEEASRGVDTFNFSTPRETNSKYIIGNVSVSE